MFDFSPFAAVLLDLDGTLYHENVPIMGAVELVHRLRIEHRLYACCSNSTVSPIESSKRLSAMGMEIPAENIFTAAAATAQHVRTHLGDQPGILNVGSDGIHELLDGEVRWVNSVEEPCDAVIAGRIDGHFSTPDRHRIALEHLRKGAKLLGICADRMYPSPRGMEIGSGATTMMLSYAANVKPIFCGKPDAVFFNALCQKLNVAADQCILIGDNLESDIVGARSVNMRTILPLTGVTRRADLENLPKEKSPDWVVNDLTEL